MSTVGVAKLASRFLIWTWSDTTLWMRVSISYITLHYTTFYITLHCITLHFMTLHYITCIVYTYTDIYIYIHTYIHIHIHIHIYIYTYTVYVSVYLQYIVIFASLQCWCNSIHIMFYHLYITLCGVIQYDTIWNEIFYTTYHVWYTIFYLIYCT